MCDGLQRYQRTGCYTCVSYYNYLLPVWWVFTHCVSEVISNFSLLSMSKYIAMENDTLPSVPCTFRNSKPHFLWKTEHRSLLELRPDIKYKNSHFRELHNLGSCRKITSLWGPTTHFSKISVNLVGIPLILTGQPKHQSVGWELNGLISLIRHSMYLRSSNLI